MDTADSGRERCGRSEISGRFNVRVQDQRAPENFVKLSKDQTLIGAAEFEGIKDVDQLIAVLEGRLEKAKHDNPAL